MKNLNRRAALAASLAFAAGGARAETFPSKPIRFLVPYPVGGIVDIVARAVAEPLAAELGQPIVVDPRPGANSTLATAMIPQAPADGYSWVIATIAHVVAPHLQPVSYDPLKDFQGAALVAVATSVATVNASLPIYTLKELVEYGKANPGKLNYLNPGNGTGGHLMPEQLKVKYGIDITSISYKGLPPGVQDLLGGRLELGVISTSLAAHHVKAGRLKAIALAGLKRHDDLPDVPTLAESGVPGYEASIWLALLAPAGTPAELIHRYHTELSRGFASPESQKALFDAGVSPAILSPAETGDLMVKDMQRWSKVIRDIGIKPD